MIKRVLLFFGFLLLLSGVYSLLPKPWTNSLEAKLFWGAFVKNEKGLRAINDKDYSMATNQFAEGLSTSPGLMELHYNLGAGYQMMNRSEEAVKSYNIPLKSPEQSSPEIQFLSHFNMGVLYQSGKQVDPALTNYQAALDLDPNSRKTKINIELLIQEQKGGGKGENQDKKDGENGDQDQKPQGDKDEKGKGDQDKEDKKEYAKNPQPEKKEFKSEQLSKSDVNKILGEIKQQEQKIRAEYNKKESKEQPRDKDW